MDMQSMDHAQHLHDHAAQASPDSIGAFFHRLLEAYVPRQQCMYHEPDVIWMHVVSDALITLAFYSIPIALYYFVRRRKDLSYNWMFLLFAAFILFCGTTHLFNIISIWHPVYRLDGLVKLLTALVSVATAVALWPLIPQALALPSPEQLRQSNQKLQESYRSMETLNAKLEVSNRELQDFAFVASHDLQESLRKVTAFGDMLKSEFGPALGETGADYLHRMQSAARRMQTLISDLLQLSRVTSKAQPFTTVDLSQVAGDVLGDLEVRLRQSGGAVEVGALPTIEADPLQMRQLLQNLIGNAIKYARPEEPPRVRVYTEAEPPGGKNGRSVRLCVADNGIGFEEKYVDRIFTVFQRLHDRGAYEGTGIGLAICRKIAERHGGSITARSRPGEGSTFIVTLPLKQTPRRNEDGL